MEWWGCLLERMSHSNYFWTLLGNSSSKQYSFFLWKEPRQLVWVRQSGEFCFAKHVRDFAPLSPLFSLALLGKIFYLCSFLSFGRSFFLLCVKSSILFRNLLMCRIWYRYFPFVIGTMVLFCSQNANDIANDNWKKNCMSEQDYRKFL